MAWDTTLPIMIRSAIGDTGNPPKYSDDNLAPIILTAAQSLFFTLPGPNLYTLDIENLVLTPDPTEPATLDNAFTYLLTLKSSVMLLFAEVRRYGQQAIAIRDGTSAIDLKRDLAALTKLAESYANELTSGIFLYARNSSGIAGKAILSPYKGLINGLDGYFYNDRSRRY